MIHGGTLNIQPLSDGAGRITAGPLVSIVDDDASMREAMSFVLQADGLRTIAFDSAAAFLESAVLHTLACIVLDLRMPGVTGLELVHRLAGEPSVPPVVLVSAHLDETIEKNARDAGVVACIRKPFTDEALLQAVHVALRR